MIADKFLRPDLAARSRGFRWPLPDGELER
jgi:hypothetical protein